MKPPWAVVLVVAAITAVTPIAMAAVVLGSSWVAADWLIVAAAAILGLSVVLSRVRAELGAALLILSVLVLLDPLPTLLDDSSTWVSLAGITLYAGLCWIAATLGRELPTARSVGWMAGFLLAWSWQFGFDVAVMMLTLGWWVVGRVLRHQSQLADRLRNRAAQLVAEQERSTAEAVRLERCRIARELHDVVAHCMTVIVVQARVGQQLSGSDSSATGEALDAISMSVAEAEADLDALVAVMAAQPAATLTAAYLDDLVRRSATAGTRISVTVRGDLAALPPAVAGLGRRAVQEAVTNALRYAPSSDIGVTVDCRNGLELIVVNEPPRSAVLPGLGGQRGLDGLHERAVALDGRAEWGPTSTDGWRVHLVLPGPGAGVPGSLGPDRSTVTGCQPRVSTALSAPPIS